MPLRREIDPVELKPWLGNLTLVELTDGGRDFFYRVHGSTLVEIAAVEMTEKRASQGAAGFWSIVIREYQAIRPISRESAPEGGICRNRPVQQTGGALLDSAEWGRSWPQRSGVRLLAPLECRFRSSRIRC